ncbi:ester hydrolase C11orf54 homolog [Chironomus tepperi]|uniref:ester hydrolase C11orf54 homolog n=1 Tax=Chironomus tepperi TaxID=113505 RepID=UPI00391F5537
MSLDSKSLKYESKYIFTPTLEELSKAITPGLNENFAEVTLSIIDCPDLSKAPYHLASSGLTGDTIVMEYGSPDYLLPLVDKSKIYDLIPLIRNISGYENKEFFIAGAGAGPHPLINQNCEGIMNLKVDKNGKIINETHISRVTDDGSMDVQKVPSNETRSALLGNVFISEGKVGKVLKVSCKKRIGSENFISAMRLSMAKHFKDTTVGVGGVFLIKTGKVKQHVMNDFSKSPINTEDELNNWLKFYDMSAPLIAVGTFVTDETDFDLRLQHFHSFSMHGEAGHYHYDVTPDIVEYEGYFNVGARIVRIDRPESSLKFGRD